MEMTPAPISVERFGPIDRDEAYDRDYIPLPGGWEIQTKGKGSTYRICDPNNDDLAIPASPYLHDTLTQMARDVHASHTALLHQLAELQANLAELRQACWDARALLGFDNDGDPTPDALVYPSLADLVRRDAAEFRKDYDEACNEAHAAERAREEAVSVLRFIDDTVPYSALGDTAAERLAAFLAASGGKDNG